jgi:protein-tyrosine-phosphatase
MVESLLVSDRSPDDLAARFGLASNLLAHHLGVLETAGLLHRSVSRRDRRRRYVSLIASRLDGLAVRTPSVPKPMLFVCTHNSARSQLAAALWRDRIGTQADSAGTEPAERVHPQVIDAARRHRIGLEATTPRHLDEIPRGTKVVTVCDRAREDLVAGPDWWHWSLPDPAETATDEAFDDVIARLEARIATVTGLGPDTRPGTPTASQSPSEPTARRHETERS